MSTFETNFSDVFQSHGLSEPTKKHLSKVYLVLSGLVGSCALGSMLSVAYGFGGRGTGLLGFICLIWVFMSDMKSASRLPALILFGLLEGMSIGPIVNLALQIDPSLITTALVSTLGIFVSFSLAALYSDKRQTMYLGGLLSSGLSILFALSLFSLIFGIRSEILFNINLYAGLAIFMGYIVYDTQIIILKAEQGEKDHYLHALTLFIDLVQIFVRILIILIKNNKKKDKD